MGAHIVGVYEDRLSLDLHAVLTLGCVASVAPACRSRPLAEGYRLQELQVHLVSVPELELLHQLQLSR